jgi:hypothetical protein
MSISTTGCQQAVLKPLSCIIRKIIEHKRQKILILNVIAAVCIATDTLLTLGGFSVDVDEEGTPAVMEMDL